MCVTLGNGRRQYWSTRDRPSCRWTVAAAGKHISYYRMHPIISSQFAVQCVLTSIFYALSWWQSIFYTVADAGQNVSKLGQCVCVKTRSNGEKYWNIFSIAFLTYFWTSLCFTWFDPCWPNFDTRWPSFDTCWPNFWSYQFSCCCCIANDHYFAQQLLRTQL